MKSHLGKPLEDDSFLKEDDSWQPMKEPPNSKTHQPKTAFF